MRQSVWLISLGDLLTLLLCFFLAIISLSPPANHANSKGSWNKNAVSPPDGINVADNEDTAQEKQFYDWSLTLNDPNPASNELEVLAEESKFKGVKHLIVEGCFFNEWIGASRRESEALVSGVVQKLMMLGASSELIEARIDAGCNEISKVVVSGLYG